MESCEFYSSLYHKKYVAIISKLTRTMKPDYLSTYWLDLHLPPELNNRDIERVGWCRGIFSPTKPPPLCQGSRAITSWGYITSGYITILPYFLLLLKSPPTSSHNYTSTTPYHLWLFSLSVTYPEPQLSHGLNTAFFHYYSFYPNVIPPYSKLIDPTLYNFSPTSCGFSSIAFRFSSILYHFASISSRWPYLLFFATSPTRTTFWSAKQWRESRPFQPSPTHHQYPYSLPYLAGTFRLCVTNHPSAFTLSPSLMI